MRYIFEDNGTSNLSLFFRQAFNHEVQGNIEFCSSNTHLLPKAKSLLSSTDEEVVIFIDLVEDNKYTVEIFRDLWKLQKRNPGRIRVVPLMCSEYYLLQSIVKDSKNSFMIVNPTIVDICLHSPCHRVDTAWVTKKKGKKVSFEKYCKHAVNRALLGCLFKYNRQDTEEYLTQDCICGSSHTKAKCYPCSIVDKAIKYIEEFPIIPVGSKSTKTQKIGCSEYERYLIDRIKYHNYRVHNYYRYMKSNGDNQEILANLIKTDSRGIPL